MEFFKNYRVGFITPDLLWVMCTDCQIQVFAWRDGTGFNASVMVDAIVRHDSVWHRSETD